MEQVRTRTKLGELLMGAGMLTNAELEAVLAEQVKTRKRLGQILIERNLLTEEEIMDTLAVQLSLDQLEMGKTLINPDVKQNLPKEVAKKHNMTSGEIEGKRKLGEMLIEVGLVTRGQLDLVLEKQKITNHQIGEILVNDGIINENDLIETLEVQMGIAFANLEKNFINPDVPRLIKENIARKHLIFPFGKDKGKLQVAMVDPLNIYAIDDVRLATGFDVEPMIAQKEDILRLIDQYYGKQNAEQAVEEFAKQFDLDNIKGLDEATLAEINKAPIVKLVSNIIRQAIQSKGSDIHIEPFDNYLRIRLRIDGELQEVMRLQKTTHSALITRIKIMGKMDIAEKRIPLDGRVETEIDGREVDMRISSLPTIYGEKIVIRLLDRGEFLVTKKELGFSTENLQRFEQVIKNPNGIILVTGPTGSGKSTTLYTILMELNKENRNIITVEDPVEYRMTGINQVQVNNKAGLTFASGLRSILRQDPDIIMIGEIRDAETAQIAVRAAITGHLVLSTMHTNDTASTINRLNDMGVESYLISAALVGVLAQRLVRKLCPKCKERYEPDSLERKLLNTKDNTVKIYRARGCNACNNSGYKGRTTIAEIMLINRELKTLIEEKKSLEEIHKAAIKAGMMTLQRNCSQLVLTGLTSMDELIKNTSDLE
ncbi:MAG: ATPase, T2SS/T4P/T4SS family [Desulfosporosinus sp.]|nr:ATPase, T2SS/T4P/T4SS family [Desulfosporosinus sp.]